jgi:hypothetical protein
MESPNPRWVNHHEILAIIHCGGVRLDVTGITDVCENGHKSCATLSKEEAAQSSAPGSFGRRPGFCRIGSCRIGEAGHN